MKRVFELLKDIESLQDTVKYEYYHAMSELSNMRRDLERSSDDPCYVITGINNNVDSAVSKRWIQFSRSGNMNPIIQTQCAYCASRVVGFKTKYEAYDFIDAFNKSSNRKEDYNITWKVSEYHSHGKIFFDTDRRVYSRVIRKLYPVDTQYGRCYEVRWESESSED